MNEIESVGEHRRESEGSSASSEPLRWLTAEELLPQVYEELRRLAAARLARLAPGQTFQATSLVHEAFLKLVGTDDPGWCSKEHFFAAAAIAMRHILVDAARRKAAVKRGGGRLRVTLSGEVEPRGENPIDMLVIEEALERLESQDARKGRIVTLRFFGGLSIEQTAIAMGVSHATVERDWAFARAWLHNELDGADGTA